MSFADPPVSREMGYEISTMESPNKSTKFSTARSLTLRKDSPLKSKQFKLKTVLTDAEKSSTENNIPSESSAEVALQAEKANESLIKMSEDTDSAGTDEQTSDNSSKKDNVVELDIDEEEVEQEVEITVDVLSICVPENINQDQQVLPREPVQSTVPMNCIETEDSETQQDIFDGSDTKSNSSMIQSNDDANTSSRDNSVDSIKLNVTNDSVIDALPTKEDNLDDTVDIQNVIGLDSTVNTDEVFCGKLSRSSTSANAKNVAEQDTLPVTDSMFASLPSSQDSRCENQNNVELDPGFLDSIQPIYPALSSCRESINVIIERLTTPLWKQSLQSYFTDRNLFTVGDLAQLSEREINRMPLKGKPKIEFVRKVLRSYESMYGAACHKESVSTLVSTSLAKPLNKPEQLLTTTTSDQAYRSQCLFVIPKFVDVAAVSFNNESLSCSTSLARSAEKLHNNSSTEKSLTEHLDRTSSMNSDVCSANISSVRGSSDLSALDVSAVNKKTNTKILIVAHNSPEKPTNYSTLTMLPIATSSISKNLYVRMSFYILIR